MGSYVEAMLKLCWSGTIEVRGSQNKWCNVGMQNNASFKVSNRWISYITRNVTRQNCTLCPFSGMRSSWKLAHPIPNKAQTHVHLNMYIAATFESFGPLNIHVQCTNSQNSHWRGYFQCQCLCMLVLGKHLLQVTVAISWPLTHIENRGVKGHIITCTPEERAWEQG